MKKAKKLVVLILAIVLSVPMSVPANADILSSSKVTATIDSQLQSLLADASAEESIPVDIWLYETSTIEVREQKIYTKIGLSKKQITADSKGVISSEKIDEYIAVERSMYAEEREQQYALIQKDYASIRGLQKTRENDTRLFYSRYAPMISAELTPTEIKLLARDSRVQTIYYSPNVQLKDQCSVSIPSIDANYVRDTLGYTGSGVKIGMIETGVPDSSDSCFSGVSITYDSSIQNVGNKYSGHADMVAAIMVGQETTFHGVTYGEGIVPDANLYVTCCSDDNDWRGRVEWLLSQGVHVINMSASFVGTDPGYYQGYYRTHERWLDHISYSHYVHFVTVSGNTGWSVASPGMAYNVLTVGAIDDKNNDDETDDVLCDFSGYHESSDPNTGTHPTNKPDLVAPGENIATAVGTDSGTSFAAPHVTAVVAQLCQYIGSLKVMPAVVKAILTASVSHEKHSYDTGIEDMDNYDLFGAGVVNAKAAFETALAFRMMGGSFPAKSEAESARFFTFTVSDGQRVRVSLTWLKYAYLPDNVSHVICDPSELGIVDLDLCIYDPNGVLVGDWRADYNNTEIADFIASQSGTYTIGVYLNESSTYEVPIGLAWWLAPANSLSTSG